MIHMITDLDSTFCLIKSSSRNCEKHLWGPSPVIRQALNFQVLTRKNPVLKLSFPSPLPGINLQFKQNKTEGREKEGKKKKLPSKEWEQRETRIRLPLSLSKSQNSFSCTLSSLVKWELLKFPFTQEHYCYITIILLLFFQVFVMLPTNLNPNLSSIWHLLPSPSQEFHYTIVGLPLFLIPWSLEVSMIFHFSVW